jgi:hypothetical protein
MNCDLPNFDVHYFGHRLDLTEDEEKEAEANKATEKRFIHL